MLLRTLLEQTPSLQAALPTTEGKTAASVLIQGLSQNSQTLQTGDLYIARAGQTTHGLHYLDVVINQGAAAILAEPNAEWPTQRLTALASTLSIPLLICPTLANPQLALLAQAYYGNPTSALRLVGITGTNGKTSVAYYLAQAWELLNPNSVGLIGTLGQGRLNDLQPTNHTTPDLLSLYAELARQRATGISQVMLEVSSHALDQERIAGLSIDSALFTNLTRDHQDYHGSMAAYGAAKAKLFHIPNLQHAVIQAEDPFGHQLLTQLADSPVHTIALGGDSPARYTLHRRIHTTPHGLQIDYQTPWGNGTFASALWGRFNADNLLLALGSLLQADIPLVEAIQALSQVRPAPGRMARYGRASQPQILIDYAHTPDALAQALGTVRQHTSGRVICVFGCGGDRDTGKRPQMGAIAARLADQIWLTDDNPRTEPPAQITEQILRGIQTLEHIHLEHDRTQAIVTAIAQAQPDDSVLIAGKGHEPYQEIGTQRIPYSDTEPVETALLAYG